MILAAASGTDLTLLGQYGVLGLFCGLLVIFARTAYKRETDRSDAYATQIADLNRQVYDALIKCGAALDSSSRTVTQLVETIRDLDRAERSRR